MRQVPVLAPAHSAWSQLAWSAELSSQSPHRKPPSKKIEDVSIAYRSTLPWLCLYQRSGMFHFVLFAV